MVAPLLLVILSIAHGGAVASPDLQFLDGRGVWLQSAGSFDTGRIADLKQMGLTRVHVMATSSFAHYSTCATAPAIKSSTSLSKLKGIVTALQEQGLHPVITLFVTPNAKAIDQLLAADGPVMSLLTSGAVGLEFDLEGGWSKSAVCGFRDHREAVTYLIQAARHLGTSLPVGVTTHIGRATDPKLALDLADWVSMQVYAHCEPGGNDCPSFDSPSEGPGGRPLLIAKNFTKYTGPILAGLAAYQQVWPQHTVAQAMDASRHAVQTLKAQDSRVKGANYWSTYWLLKPGAAEGVYLKGHPTDQ